MTRLRILGTFHHVPLSITFPNSVLRNALDWAFYQQVCVAKGTMCLECDLRFHCLFPKIFLPEVASLDETAARATSPMLLEWSKSTAEETSDDSNLNLEFEWQLTLFGTWINYVPYFIAALERLSRAGIGRRLYPRRATFDITGIYHDDFNLYDPDTQTLCTTIPTTLLDWKTDTEASPQSVPHQLRVIFETPTRLKKRISAEKMTFSQLVRSIVRRLDFLWEQIENQTYPFEVASLVEKAASVETVMQDIHWHSQQHYSPRSRERFQMGGYLGSIEYRGDLTDFLPLLNLGQQVYVGRYTSFGYGKFRYEIVTA